MKKIKKFFILSTFVFSFFAITACKSTKVKDEAKNNEEPLLEDVSADLMEEELPEGEQQDSKKGKKDKKKKEKKQKPEKVKKTKQNKEDSADKNYVGWINRTAKDVVYKTGILQIKAKPGFGTFNISVVNDNGKNIPVLATGNEFTSSSVSLKTSKKTYKLLADGKITTTASRNANGINIIYKVPDVADVKVGFECFSSEPEGESDMMKVTVSVKNTGSKKEEFSVKNIFDTVLGESGKYHFYSSEGLPVKSEVSYRTMQNQKWFVSKNDNAAMQFLFYGEDATPSELVALANYSTFQKNTWEPDMLSYRAFDNILSYNNSAVGIIWPAAKLMPKESAENVFYIAFSTDGRKPNGDKYLFEPEEETVKTAKDLKEEKTEAEAEPSEEEDDLPKTKTVKISKKNLSKEQLTPEYIQNLIDRITALENDIDNVNEDELVQLNAELDAILEFLR